MLKRLETKIIFGLFAIAALLCSSCSGFLYYPVNHQLSNPSLYDIKEEDVHFSASDGTKLFGWYLHARQKPKALVVFFHGNAENLSSHYRSLAWILNHNIDYFIFDYRGYWLSEGKPSPQGTVEDGKAAIRLAYGRAQQMKVPLVLFAQSLGGAIALRSLLDLQQEELRVDAIMIDSSFLSYKRVGRKVLAKHIVTWPFQLFSYLALSDSFAPGERIAELSPTPIFVMHGDHDQVVEYSLGEELFALAKEPKVFVKVEGGTHTDGFWHREGQYRRAALEFLEKRLKLSLASQSE